MGHYTLTMDAAAVCAASKLLADFKTHLSGQGGRASGVTGDHSSWKGVAATVCLAEVGRIGSTMSAAGPKVDPVTTALDRLAAEISTATGTTLPALNKRWDDADTAHTEAYTAADAAYDRAVGGQDDAAPDPTRIRQLAQSRDMRKSNADTARVKSRAAIDADHTSMMAGLRQKVKAVATAMDGNQVITFDASQWSAVRGGKLSASVLAGLRAQILGGNGLMSRSDLVGLGKDINNAIASGKSPKDALKLVAPGQVDLLVQLGLVSDSVVSQGLADDPAVSSALTRLRNVAKMGVDGSSAVECSVVTSALGDLSPAQREAVLASLNDDELRTIHEQSKGMGDVWKMSDFEHQAVGVTSPTTVARLARLWQLDPALVPGGTATYGVPTGPLFADPTATDHNVVNASNEHQSTTSVTEPGMASPDDVNQGGVGDCWFIAAMKGLGEPNAKGPGFYDGLVKENLNGTLDIRLYDEGGHQHAVTVTNELPLDPGGHLVYARGTTLPDGSQETWPAYVEKAMAHTYTGGIGDTIEIDKKTHVKAPPNSYLDIWGDYSSVSVQALTGKGVHGVGDGSFLWFGGSPEEQIKNIQHELDGHHAVFISTKGCSDKDTLLGGGVVANHLYYVDHVEPNGNIVLANPWGSSDDKGRVVLTPHEFEQISVDVTAADG